jgi:hypothetical protein
LVASLDNVVLLRTIRRGEVSLDSLVGVVRDELNRRELVVVVRAQHPKLAPTLFSVVT